ncbi:MAG: hypothetical protein LC623_06500 [Halobacteriales archaeon]|nr:hypothetical protein [Halobacteriales archaeon]
MKALLVVALLSLAAAEVAVAPAAAQAAPAPDLRSAPWSHGAMCQDPAITDGIPEGGCRHMRILLTVDPAAHPETAALLGMANLPVTTTVDVAAALRGLGEYPAFANGQLSGFELDFDSLLLVEVQAGTWQPVRLDGAQNAVPEALLVFRGDLGSVQPFDARSNPVVTLQWVLSGPTQGARHYLLYLDSLHEGKKTPVQAQASQLGRVASAVGPGRGNTAYVALHGDLGLSSSTDPRTLRVTNLQATEVHVDVYGYERFNIPKAQPFPELRNLALAAGQTRLLRLPADYGEEAAKVVARDGLVLVEASSRVGSSTYQPGSSRLFLPSADGGYVGTAFAGQSPVATNWLVFCPGIPENTAPCQVQTSAGGSAAIPVGSSFAALPVPAGQSATLRATTGLVAVERMPTGSPSREQMGLTLWPPADGPVTSSLFFGEANSDQVGLQDKLMLVTSTSGSRLQVFSLQAHAFLADSLDPRGPGLFSESVAGAWGTNWQRDWRLESTQQHMEHEDGPVRIRDLQGRGIAVGNGVVGDDSSFSVFMPILTPDGGLHYSVTIPADSSGNPLGRVALFSPFPGTHVQASRVAGSGAATDVGREGLQQDEFVQSFIDRPGTWRVNASHPVLLTWVKVGTEPMTGFAPALTLGLTATAEAAQFAGYAFQIPDVNLFQTIRPGNTASFELTVQNRARKVDGTLIHDSARLTAAVPGGWPAADVIPSTVVLPPGESRTAKVDATVPGDVDLAQGGATVRLHAASTGQPGYQVDLPLRINYKVERGVDLTADGKDGTAERAVTSDEVATYIVRLTNTGTVPDAFHLEFATPPALWSIEVECPFVDTCFEDGEHTTPVLGVGKSLDYHVSVTPSAQNAARLTTPILATSVADPSVTDAVRLLTVLDAERKLSVIVPETSQVVLPGAAANFTITFKNDGEQDEEVRLVLNATGPAAWVRPGALVDDPDFDAPVPLATLNNTFGVRLHQVVHLRVHQQVPADAPPGQIMIMRLAVNSGRSESGGQASERSEHQLRVISGRLSGLNVTGLPEAADILPGTSIDLPLTIHSSSNAAQVVRLQASVQPTPSAWNVTLDGKPGPWALNLTAHGSLPVTLKLSASPHAIATSVAPSTLLLHLGVPGASVLPVKVKLRVPDALDVTVLDATLRLEAGRSQEVALHLRNRGNVPVVATGSFPDLEWPARWGNATVGTGEDGTLRVWLDVPASALGRTATLRLVDRTSGATLATPALKLDVRTPQLEIQVTGTRALANGLRSYTLTVTNHAASPARMVQIQLLQGERVLDAAVLESILPGASGTVHLVSSAPDGLLLRIRSADDPAGRTITLEAVSGDGPAAARPAPAPAALPILALAALALALRRRA